jgi:hypothetical protein
LWCIAAGGLAVALLCGVIAAAGFAIDNHMDNEGVTTSATVKKVRDDVATLEFLTEDGQRTTAELMLWAGEFAAVDDEIEITYDPDDPSYVVKAGSNEDHWVAMGFGFAALFGLAVAVSAGVGAVLIHRARGKAARSTGYHY